MLSRDFPPISLLICETLSTSATLCLFGLVWGQPWSHVTSPHILTCPQWLWKEARWLTLKGLEVRSQAKWTQTENSQTAVKRYHSQWYQLANSRFLRYMHILTRSVISEKTKSWRFRDPNSWWWLSLSPGDYSLYIISSFVRLCLHELPLDLYGLVWAWPWGPVISAHILTCFRGTWQETSTADSKGRGFKPRLSGHQLKTPQYSPKRILF